MTVRSLFLTLSLALIPHLTLASDSPVTIQSLSAAGAACPEGTVAITLAPDRRSFSVLFDQALVQSSPTEPLADKICEITIVSKVPAGWKLNLYSNDFRGFSQVEKGSQTFQRTSYYRLTPQRTWKLLRRGKKTFKPGFNNNYSLSHKLPVYQSSLQKCQDHFETITVQIQLASLSRTNKTGTAELALDSFDGGVQGLKHACNYH